MEILDSRSSAPEPEGRLIDLYNVPLTSVSDRNREQLKRIKGWCVFVRADETETSA